MIENMFGQSNLRPSTATNGPSAQAPPNAESVAMLQGISSSALSGAPASIPQQSVQKIDNVTSLDKLITTYPAVAVFFTSATCPPCRVIKPDFEQLIKDKNQDTPSLRILGAIVDTSVAFDAGAKYQVRSTPTFMFFHNGQKVRPCFTRASSFTQLLLLH
jgi:thiol-disulfide isomerase/thioredoxin